MDVRFTASFADDGKPGNLPNAEPFGAEANIYAMNPDSFAWFCYDPKMNEPPVAEPPGGYWVPTWDFTGPGIDDQGNTPQVILPGETHSRDLEFGCYTPILSGTQDWITIVDSYEKKTEILLNRTPSLKVSDFPDVLSADPGTMSIQSPGHASDCSVFFNQPKIGSLAFNLAGSVSDHFWWPTPGGNPDNLMLRGRVAADWNEAVRWESITLKALGSGNDATDIDQIRVWIDLNNNGVVEPAIDQIAGVGTYPFDDAVTTISLVPGAVIPVGGTVRFLTPYVMNPSVIVPPDRTYRFEASSAACTGELSGASVPVFGFSLTSCTKVRGKKAIKIGEAKLPRPIGDPTVLLEDEIITADFQTRMGLFYIEEKDRSAGIGVKPTTWIGPFSVGSKVSVLGHLQLLDGAELVLVPEYTIFSPPDPVKPLGMNNRNSGGGVYGDQPAVVDDARSRPLPEMSKGLNSVGLLVKMWGKPTFKQDPYYLSTTNPANMAWIDDGSFLHDGFLTSVQKPIAGVGVWLPPLYLPPDGYWGVTGILRAIRGPMGLPVRVLVPRDETDITQYPTLGD